MFVSAQPCLILKLFQSIFLVRKCQALGISVYVTDIETDLQQVWSVRKNIHHQRDVGKQTASYQPVNSSLPSVPTTGHYSRHGAITAQQSPHGVPSKAKDSTGNGKHRKGWECDLLFVSY